MGQSWIIAGSFKRLRDALGPSVFPPRSLKFRTAGFPKYGFKRKLHGDLRRTSRFGLYAAKVRESWGTVTGPQGASITARGPRQTRTIPSRGPWLPSGLCCPPDHRLLWPHPSLSLSSTHLCIRGWLLQPRGLPRAENKRVPNLIGVSVRTCHPQDPGGPAGCTRLLLHRP